MEKRIVVKDLVPKAYNILIDMEKLLHASGLSHQLRELIKIRASQINKCAYCLEMHTDDAKKNGETEKRLHAIAAWEESPYFTEAERAAFELTEAITKISEHGVTTNVYENVKKHYSDKQIAEMILLINQINSWNRIAVATKLIYSSEEK